MRNSTYSAASKAASFPLISTIAEGFNSIFVRRKTLKALDELDDRLLRDVGLTRSDVEKMRYRRP